MKNHIGFKLLSIALATVFLLCSIGSALSIVVLIGTNLYDETVEEAYDSQLYYERRDLARDLAHAYMSLELGNLPQEYYEQYYGTAWKDAYFREGYYYYSIFDENGVMVESTLPDDADSETFYEIELGVISYRHLVSATSPAADNTVINEDEYYDAENECYIQVNYQIKDQSDYIVQLYILPGAYSYDAPWQMLQQLYTLRYHLFWVFGLSLLLFIGITVFLCCTAGRKPNSDEVRAGGLNRLPLDLYTAAIVGGVVLLVAIGYQLMDSLIYSNIILMLFLLGLVAAAASLLVVALIFAWAAQLKTKELYWLKNSVIGRVLRLIGWVFRKIGNGIRWCFQGMRSLIRLLPVTWQWLLTAAMMIIVPLLLIVFAQVAWYPWQSFWLFMFIVSLFVDVGIIIYGGYCFGTLLKGAKRMSQGDLRFKINTKFLLGSFRDFGSQLNSLSDAIYLAAEQQTRSERMKTELITNVSHDIKTPLTSIINFVDLLQKAHTPEQEQEYLEVLSRQSAQMKKLIEDLMELSKASSGNLTVNLGKVDAVEAVNQALGEFADKLDAAGLTPVFRQPEAPIYINADGRHVWRVLFNLLTNAVKYALPGTRLYIDLMKADRDVVLSIKNVSRAELNISADELMERFVQGDASRKTEGSGLGLNIAKSLMEVQGGQLQLLLDGDLFKVTLIFPAADE